MRIRRTIQAAACAALLLIHNNTGQSASAQSVPAPRADGVFSFKAGGHETIPLAISEAGELAWPQAASARTWDTALLSVAVTADSSTAPYVEMTSGPLVERQYFPAGDAGTRWLNLSFLHGHVSGGARITLRTQGVTIASGRSELRLFSSRPDLSKAILVVAPHPDDAEIGAFGLYAERRSTVVTVTVGNAGSPTYEAVVKEPAAQYRFKGQVRLIDSVTIPWQGGVPPERAFNLGYFDARLGEMHARPQAVIPEMYGPNTDIGVYLPFNIGSLLPKRARASTWTNLVADLETVLRKVKPTVIAAPHPFLDNHRDHQFTTVALAQALARWKKPVTLLLYTNHADRNRYPYGPAGTTMSLPVIAQSVALDRVFSLPVSPDLQRTKLFALESMHDLRYTPMRQYQLAMGEGRTVDPEPTGSAPDITYLRRGPRSNELFYVYDQTSVQEMVARFLAPTR